MNKNDKGKYQIAAAIIASLDLLILAMNIFMAHYCYRFIHGNDGIFLDDIFNYIPVESVILYAAVLGISYVVGFVLPPEEKKEDE